MKHEKKKICFICTGNTCRSPMVEALFNQLNSKQNIEASSAGLMAFPGDTANENAITVLKEDYDLDLTSHRSRQCNSFLVAENDLLITMTKAQKEKMLKDFPEAAEKIFTFTELTDGEGDIRDPFGQNLAVYRQIAAIFWEKLPQLLEKITASY